MLHYRLANLQAARNQAQKPRLQPPNKSTNKLSRKKQMNDSHTNLQQLIGNIVVKEALHYKITRYRSELPSPTLNNPYPNDPWIFTTTNKYYLAAKTRLINREQTSYGINIRSREHILMNYNEGKT